MLGPRTSDGYDFIFPVKPGYRCSMKKDTRRSIRELAYYSSLGFSVALAIFIGLAIGVYIDRRFETTPWFTLIFLGLGIVAGFRNIALAIKKTRKM
jgi:ATP synthase protein I